MFQTEMNRWLSEDAFLILIGTDREDVSALIVWSPWSFVFAVLPFRRAGNHQPSNCVLSKSATDSLLRLDTWSSMRTGGIFLRPKRNNENGKRPLETWIFCEDNCVSLSDSPFYKRNTVDISTLAGWQSRGRKKQDMLQLLKTSSELFLSLTFLFWAFIIPSN